MPQLGRRAFLVLAGQAVLATAAAPLAQAAGGRPFFHGPRNERVIALTIDDGWSASRCGAILEILQQTSTPATFFPYANATIGDAGLWRSIAQAGYPIGNHTRSHPWMTALGPAAQAAELTQARAMIEAVTANPMLPVFRPPYGVYDDTVLRVARASGFPMVLLWDTSAADTSRRATPGQLIQAALRGTNGSVLLTHAGPTLTPLILPSVISLYRDLGFRFVTVAEMFDLAQPGPATPSPPPATARSPRPL
jgi:peptidoglycan/xylan/chitin deacetylase (PgdA/CDA1 family)